MKKPEFLKSCADDLVTHTHKQFLSDVLEWIEFVLQFYPDTTQIDSQKTVEGAYKAIENYARKNSKKCLTPKVATKIVIDYLGVEQKAATQLINLDDLM